MRKLSIERRAAILSALVEGNSIASTCRMFAVNKVTVLRLLADAGTLAAQFHDLTVRDVKSDRVQVDEIWSYVHTKENNLPLEQRGQIARGDTWTWVAIDADSKLVISYLTGGRDRGYATEFLIDVADRLANRVQLTSDGHAAYKKAVPDAFGNDVDYAALVKLYGKPIGTPKGSRLIPDVCIGAVKTPRIGNPDHAHINTSYVERQNLSVRMGARRFARATNGFSKKIENHIHAVALFYFHYNFIRKHETIKTTPAFMAGVADKVWTMTDFVKLLEKEEELLGGRLTDYKPAASKKE